MSVKEGTIKKDPSAKARDLPAPDGGVDVSQFIDTNTTGGKTPLYREIPKELKLVVELPTVKNVGDCELDVAADNVVLEVAEKFYLDLPLPYEIDAAKAKAKFDKHRTPAELQIVMPVVPKQIPLEEPEMPWEAVDEQDRLDNLEEEELPEQDRLDNLEEEE